MDQRGRTQGSFWVVNLRSETPARGCFNAGSPLQTLQQRSSDVWIARARGRRSEKTLYGSKYWWGDDRDWAVPRAVLIQRRLNCWPTSQMLANSWTGVRSELLDIWLYPCDPDPATGSACPAWHASVGLPSQQGQCSLLRLCGFSGDKWTGILWIMWHLMLTFMITINVEIHYGFAGKESMRAVKFC